MGETVKGVVSCFVAILITIAFMICISFNVLMVINWDKLSFETRNMILIPSAAVYFIMTIIFFFSDSRSNNGNNN